MTYEKRWDEKRWAGIRWEELRWDEVWGVKSAVWSVGREECSVKCEVWSLDCEECSEKGREECSAKCEVWSAKSIEECSVKCGVWSVKCGVLRVQCEVKCWLRRVQCEECSVKCEDCQVWSVTWSFKCDMWNKTPVSQSARTHGLLWRTAHASSIDEKGLIYIYISLRQLPPQSFRSATHYPWSCWSPIAWKWRTNQIRRELPLRDASAIALLVWTVPVLMSLVPTTPILPLLVDPLIVEVVPLLLHVPVSRTLMRSIPRPGRPGVLRILLSGRREGSASAFRTSRLRQRTEDVMHVAGALCLELPWTAWWMVVFLKNVS